jgi:hypothetical protein
MKTIVQGRVRLMVHDNGQAVILLTPDEPVSAQLREMMMGLPPMIADADMWVAGGKTYPVVVAKTDTEDESTTAKFARALRLLADALENSSVTL